MLLPAHIQAADFSAPEIQLPEVDPPKEPNDIYPITVEVKDDIVDSVKIFFRAIGDTGVFTSLPLLPSPEQNKYTTDLPDNAFKKTGIEYYVEAKDPAKNTSQAPSPDMPRQILLRKNGINWWWVTLGAVAVGAALSAGSDSSAAPTSTPTSLTVIARPPAAP